MKKAAPVVLVLLALVVAFVVGKGGRSRESVVPLSRAVADHEKAIDRGVGLALPLSADEERRMGEELDKQMGSRDPGAAPGTPAASRAALWKELGLTAAASPLVTRYRGRYAFRVVKEGGLNAFAGPGGFVYGTEELVTKLAKDPDALLFVLGHEIGHIELGHTADSMRYRADRNDPASAALSGAASVGRLFVQLHFSSGQELEADAFAVHLLRSLKRDPAAGLRAFDILGLTADKATKRDPGQVAVEGLADYFSTHPGAWERRAALEREAANTR